MSRVLQTVVALALSLTVAAHAQKKPDFSGTWVLDLARSGSNDQDPASVKGLTLVITQHETEVQIETLRPGGREVATYTFGPKPDGNTFGNTGAILKWEGSELRTSLPSRISDTAISIIEHRRLSENGQEMTIERRVDVEHGYQLNTAAPVKDVYVKRTP